MSETDAPEPKDVSAAAGTAQSNAGKAKPPKSPVEPTATPASNTVVTAPPVAGKADDMRSKVAGDLNNFKAKAADSARAAADKGKSRATEAVASVGKLIRDSAATIDENVGKEFGDYARSAAASIDGFASKMEAKEVDDIVDETREFVRKSPAVAIGAAAAIGFVLARLVKSGHDDA